MFDRMQRAKALGALGIGLVVAGLSASGPAQAQNGGYPPGRVPGAYGAPAAGDTANLLVRIDRLENRIRTMTGQIEQLQFQLRRMQEQMEAFQKDVDFRFRDNGGAKPRRERRGDLDAQPPAPTEPESPEKTRSAGRGGDAFDPAANPDAPGAPRQLGTAGNAPSRPLPQGPIATGPATGPASGPASGPANEPASGPASDGVPDPDGPITLAPPALKPEIPDLPLIPPRADASPRETYNIALAALRKRRYGEAEEGFKTLIKRHPDSTLADDAYFNLGVTYASNNRHREAAEQFLKVSTDYKKSKRAPESLYRLGLALERLGAREQACASYAEVERRYPLSPGNLRTRVERQMRRAKC